ncbi:MAG: hypothetical protein JXC32_08125 [Anaerolineae bacterium]|nr:hypothetical protein [Anaerolineae bacterium]
MVETSRYIEDAGPAFARIEVLERVGGCLQPLKPLGPIMMNTSLGVVRAQVSFWLGEQEILSHHVHLLHMSLQGWLAGVEALIKGTLEGRSEIYLPSESPELILHARRFDVPTGDESTSCYELTIGLNTGIFDSPPYISGTHYGLTLTASAEELQRFADDLLTEAEAKLYAWQRRR